MERTAELLKGCDGVIATKYGQAAVETLRENGVVPVLGSGDIREQLRKAVDIIFMERSKTL